MKNIQYQEKQTKFLLWKQKVKEDTDMDKYGP